MRIFVLGTGATGSLLARLLVRQGHQVSCGDKDPDRAHRFLGEQDQIPVQQVNARNLWSIVKAAGGHHLIVNAAPAVFNEIILRAALRLRSHYLDTSSHLTRHPFKAEQLRFDRRFREKHRAAVINAGAVFLPEAPVEAELLGLERMARQVRGGVEIVRAQAEGGAQNDLVEDGRGRVDDQVVAPGSLDDAPQVAGVHLLNMNQTPLTEKTMGAIGILIPTRDLVALAYEESREQRAGGSGPEDEDPHGTATLP